MATTKEDKPVNNGVNVEALFGAQAALANTGHPRGNRPGPASQAA